MGWMAMERCDSRVCAQVAEKEEALSHVQVPWHLVIIV